MSEKYEFTAVIQDAGSGGAFVTVPFDIEKIFGKKRLKFKATIDGQPYRGTLVRNGSPYHMLPVLKDIREKIGKSIGDEVNVEFEEDFEPRQVEIPTDLLQALESQPSALAYFNRLSYTHQREYVRWINEAKRAETRRDRIQRTIEMLLSKKSEP